MRLFLAEEAAARRETGIGSMAMHPFIPERGVGFHRDSLPARLWDRIPGYPRGAGALLDPLESLALRGLFHPCRSPQEFRAPGMFPSRQAESNPAVFLLFPSLPCAEQHGRAGAGGTSWAGAGLVVLHGYRGTEGKLLPSDWIPCLSLATSQSLFLLFSLGWLKRMRSTIPPWISPQAAVSGDGSH